MNDEDIDQYFASALLDKNEIIQEVGLQRRQTETQYIEEQFDRDLQVRINNLQLDK